MTDTASHSNLQNSLHAELSRTRHQLATANGQRYALEVERDELRAALAECAGERYRMGCLLEHIYTTHSYYRQEGNAMVCDLDLVKSIGLALDRAGVATAAANEPLSSGSPAPHTPDPVAVA